MSHAYNRQWLSDLNLIKDAKSFYKSHWINEVQFSTIKERFSTPLYHPSFLIRILLFVATLVGLSSVTGLFALLIADAGEAAISIACVVYGMASLLFVDRFFIKEKKHFKSGVNEALLYHSSGFILGGLIVLLDMDQIPAIWIGFLITAWMAYRYLDLLSTLAALLMLSYVLFTHLYEMGGVLQQLIPFLFILIFSASYFYIKALQKKPKSESWHNVLLIVESYNLVIVYLAGNYLVVRELSVNLMGLELAEGEDIPFSFLFYGLTIMTPIVYLVRGIRSKDIVILRISLLLLAASVFTFKYYYGFNRPEVTLTVAGLLLLAVSLFLFKYLRVVRNGFTRENLVAEKWGNLHLEAFIISQTLGGNQVKADDGFRGKGGEFGGGGSTGSF